MKYLRLLIRWNTLKDVEEFTILKTVDFWGLVLTQCTVKIGKRKGNTTKGIENFLESFSFDFIVDTIFIVGYVKEELINSHPMIGT